MARSTHLKFFLSATRLRQHKVLEHLKMSVGSTLRCRSGHFKETKSLRAVGIRAEGPPLLFGTLCRDAYKTMNTNHVLSPLRVLTPAVRARIGPSGSSPQPRLPCRQHNSVSANMPEKTSPSLNDENDVMIPLMVIPPGNIEWVPLFRGFKGMVG